MNLTPRFGSQRPRLLPADHCLLQLIHLSSSLRRHLAMRANHTQGEQVARTCAASFRACGAQGTGNSARPAEAPHALRCARRHNPSLKRSANGMPAGPRSAVAYPAPRGPAGIPSSPA